MSDLSGSAVMVLAFALVYLAFARVAVGQFTVLPLFLACHCVYGHSYYSWHRY